jgi:hypothetical protein
VAYEDGGFCAVRADAEASEAGRMKLRSGVLRGLRLKPRTRASAVPLP